MNRNINTISILGCGWLGLPLASHLQNMSYQIKGSTIHKDKFQEIQEANITPYRIELNPDINSDFEPEFFNSDLLIVNFPPRRREDIESFHTGQIASLIHQLRNSSIKKVLFVSSTSVYPNLNREISEADKQPADKASGKALLKAEEMLLSESNFETIIIRFGGLIGYDRKPGRFLAGKKQLKDGFAPVNLIHQDDCIGIITTLIEGKNWGGIYNACCPEHPTRKAFYEKAAAIGGFELPEFDSKAQNFKIISPNKLIQETGYEFKYRNPIDSL